MIRPWRPRATPENYAGAGTLLAPERARELDPKRWSFQPKIDGGYATVHTGADGSILRAISRTGAAWSLRDLALVRTIPNAVLCAEIERHTEAAKAARRARGFDVLHLFDAVSIGGRDLSGEAYAVRYQEIARAIALAEGTGGELAKVAGQRRAESGRYTHAAPADVRRTPLVEMLAGRDGFDELWRQFVERGDGEGLVAVDLRAPIGKRGAKRKIKLTDTVSARLTPARGGGQIADVFAYGRTFSVYMPTWAKFGDIVDISHNGFYGTGEPRFARVARRRLDLN